MTIAGGARLAAPLAAHAWGVIYDRVYARAETGRSGDNFAARLGATGYRRLDEARADVAFIAAGAPAREPRLLDLGCGTGRYSAWLARRAGAALVGLDPSLEALARAPAEATAAFLAGDACSLPLAATSVSAIHSLDVFHCLDRPAAAFEAMAQVLRPGGRAVVIALATSEPDAADPAEEWVLAARGAGFSSVRLIDQTGTWRAHMQRRHAARMADETARPEDRAASRAMIERAISSTRRVTLRLQR